MCGDKYLIQYDWRENRNGQLMFMRNWSTNSLVKFIFKFIWVSFRYEVVDVQYRNCKN